MQPYTATRLELCSTRNVGFFFNLSRFQRVVMTAEEALQIKFFSNYQLTLKLLTLDYTN